MNRPCITCGNCRRGPIGLYVCDGQRLPNPDGEYTDLPTRTAARPGLFHYAADRPDDRTQIERAMGRGPVEGWLRDPATGQRRPFEYKRADCPAWRVR